MFYFSVKNLFLPAIFLSLFLTNPAFARTHTANKNTHKKETVSYSVSKEEILRIYRKWKGVHYKMGGNSMAGIDCSALTRRVYSKTNVYLPRTTSRQIRLGKRVKKENLRVGDLVFFKSTPHQRHVGVYVGNGKFMHASSKKGVTISTLNNKYWVAHYEQSRHISS